MHLDDRTVFTMVFAMMAGALLGWLAPALVTLMIIWTVTFGYYHPPRWVHDPMARYAATVRAMERRW
jgi:hypothetical protein